MVETAEPEPAEWHRNMDVMKGLGLLQLVMLLWSLETDQQACAVWASKMDHGTSQEKLRQVVDFRDGKW